MVSGVKDDAYSEGAIRETAGTLYLGTLLPQWTSLTYSDIYWVKVPRILCVDLLATYFISSEVKLLLDCSRPCHLHPRPT